ncbi:unnamed protein product [Trichogramma brassicae]|uniref:DNA-directed DNA polymerase n=1 Tax=Trichogramma brassicae TaxID=86971 RepID=A0A6H5J2R8_9HYME|nr:unnamed protein product [Trichogramma brassicae]
MKKSHGIHYTHCEHVITTVNVRNSMTRQIRTQHLYIEISKKSTCEARRARSGEAVSSIKSLVRKSLSHIISPRCFITSVFTLRRISNSKSVYLLIARRSLTEDRSVWSELFTCNGDVVYQLRRQLLSSLDASGARNITRERERERESKEWQCSFCLTTAAAREYYEILSLEKRFDVLNKVTRLRMIDDREREAVLRVAPLERVKLRLYPILNITLIHKQPIKYKSVSMRTQNMHKRNCVIHMNALGTGQTQWVPFVIYADFECVLKPVTEARAYSVHEAFSCGLYLKCNFDDELSEYRCYRKVNDDDMSPSEWFAQNLQDIADKVLEFFDNPKPMYFTSVEKVKFEKADICHICKRGFTENDVKVRDHSHFTGEYRGAAHSKCNINYRDVRFVPVIFHNLSGYDSHLFIREVATGFPGRVWVLPQTKERYISFVKFMEDQRLSFRFIDSFKFMSSSLDNLAKNLKQQPTLRKVFGQDYDDSAQIDLLTKKGVFSIRVHLIAREAPRDSTTTARTVLQLSHGQRYFYQRLRGCEGSVGLL